MSFCSKCGNELIEGQDFCPKCGNAVNSSALLPLNSTDLGKSSSGAVERLSAMPIALALVSYAMPFMQSPLRSVSGFEVLLGAFLVLPFITTIIAGITAVCAKQGATMAFSIISAGLYGILTAWNLHEQNDFWHLGSGVYVYFFLMAIAIGITIWRGLKV